MANPKNTAGDIGWAALFMALFLPLMAGGMFVAAAYVTPALLGSPNSVPRHGAEKAVEFGLLFGGMAVGMGAALLIFCLIARRFLDTATHQRWVLQFENGAQHFSAVQLALGRYFLKHTRPGYRTNSL